MSYGPVLEKVDNHPVVIAGPCSAETEEQVLATAKKVRDMELRYFRAGIWKPRTRPNTFEGVGKIGLGWMKKAQEMYGLKTMVEVATARHAFEALKFGVDILWIGARTTVNPFSVQEIADVLEGVDIPVLVKNPMNPDLSLWMGALERFDKVGISRLGAIHRGFSSFNQTKYRNVPHWDYPIELMRRIPGIQMINDPSHISGRRDGIFGVAQKALDLNFDGLMIETHPDPDNALSDAKQQLLPDDLMAMLDVLRVRKKTANNPIYRENIDDFRHKIDNLDTQLMDLLVERMNIVEKIGVFKKDNEVAILQPRRWEEITKKTIELGVKNGLSENFIIKYLRAIHEEAINRQSKVMNIIK